MSALSDTEASLLLIGGAATAALLSFAFLLPANALLARANEVIE
jgi:hypothetical protein